MPEKIRGREQLVQDFFAKHFYLLSQSTIIEIGGMGASAVLGDYNVLPKSTKDPYIVQIGASIGLDTIHLAQRHPSSKILCYEPNPHTFDKLYENTHLFPGINIIPSAVSNYSGHASFNINKNSSWGDSLVPGNHQQSIIVPVVAASSIFQDKKVDLATIDVEGSELQIMRNLDSTRVINNVNHFVIEFHGNVLNQGEQLEIYEILQRNGYKFTTGFGVRNIFIPRIFSLMDPFRASIVIHAFKN